MSPQSCPPTGRASPPTSTPAMAGALAPYRIHRYPAHLIETWHLPDGRRLTLRPVLPQDDVLEQAFVARLSPASRRYRFHGAVRGLSTGLATQMTNIDYCLHMGFIVTVLAEYDEHGEQHETMIADARYVTGADGETAEFAIAVAETWAGKGIGQRLLSALCLAACRNGLRWICGEVLADNAAMLCLVARCGFSVRPNEDDETVLQVQRSVETHLPAAHRETRGDSFFGALGQSITQWIQPSRRRVV
ncbi:hypothetical protein BH11PSE9_BH11PSE9_04110 [soil metagenome]